MDSEFTIKCNGHYYKIELEHLIQERYIKYDSSVHSHPSYHLILTNKGNISFTVENSDKLLLKENSLLFINPLVKHSFSLAPSSEVEHISIIWRFVDENGKYGVFPLQQILQSTAKECKPFIEIKLARSDANSFRQRHRYALQLSLDPSYSPWFMMAIYELWFLGFRLVMQNYCGIVNDTPGSLPHNIASVIDRELANPDLNIGFIALKLDKHPNYINMIFKKNTGVTINAYIIRKRIELAKSILLNSDESMSRIATLCGFNQQSYFTRTFTKLCGTSPLKFKNINAD